ncbi:ABC transporter ATP-binding protein [Puniceicoccaceae bacterium K14]|nr:ABC transporter ATP-binding protein [Puniceicoccaceae bacterium K14]
MNDRPPKDITSNCPLVCSNISKSYGQRTLFRDLSLEIKPGEAVALLGASGSGKSTLLHCLNGIEPVDEGEILLDGIRISHMAPSELDNQRKSKIGTVFQFFHLLPTLTAFENIELSLQLTGVPQNQIAPRVEHLMKRLGIAERSNAFPRDLSGGEKQRVAIARAVAHQPKIILADEPTGNLDSESGKTALNLLKAVCSEENAALLMVTHSEHDASVCDRQLVLEQEKIRTLG